MRLLAILAIFVITALLILSLVLNMREWKWRADIETHEGRKKIRSLAYERLELVRLRLKKYRRGYHLDSDYMEIPLDAPPRKAKNALEAGASAYFFRLDDEFDDLRVYGWKEGVRHLVYKTYFNDERLSRVKEIVDRYNDSLPSSPA